MCGKEDVALRKARIEGTVMQVCKDCASFGTVLEDPASSSSSSTPSQAGSGGKPTRSTSSGGGSGPRRKDPLEETAEMALKEDYGKVIQRAREKRGWSQEDLGKKIAEKVSVIKELEGQKMRPPDSLRKKLERTLDIELMEEVEPVDVRSGSTSSRGMTLGDMIKRESEED